MGVTWFWPLALLRSTFTPETWWFFVKCSSCERELDDEWSCEWVHLPVPKSKHLFPWIHYQNWMPDRQYGSMLIFLLVATQETAVKYTPLGQNDTFSSIRPQLKKKRPLKGLTKGPITTNKVHSNSLYCRFFRLGLEVLQNYKDFIFPLDIMVLFVAAVSQLILIGWCFLMHPLHRVSSYIEMNRWWPLGPGCFS